MSEDHFARLKEITNKLVPNEINLVTNYNGWEDSIDLRGKNLKISIIEENSEFDYKLRFSDERGLHVIIPCLGIKYLNEYRNGNHIIIEIYSYIYKGIARITIKGEEVAIQHSDKDKDYSVLINQAKSCQICTAMKEVEAIIGYNNGNLDADIMFIAEAPGPKGADITGIPLQGDATGNNFDKLLSFTCWKRSDIYITNAVLCCPTDDTGKVRKPTKHEIQNCHSYLARIIDLVNPKVIVTLGKKALEALKSIENHQLILKEDVASYTKWNNRWVYPLYHPSPQVINTKTRTMEQQRTDFKQLEHNYHKRIIKGLDPISYNKKEI
ncbi:uracil-DNA glycosylase [Heyndrickxia oleronia]|jgi:uracil-DNA glycosylase family 4|uniref:uracil-DNA glycosylase n=1 Tax=Heyndrickxia oleronia TaxID=38875 RepID=UPI0024331B66|nr:uracil-DNA glycosylase [Heyndrickxia oleronia]MCI1588976.1 uracil-DNA glycosylase [Heyndrickxia oleronia]MCI1611932.1 uracil-DNA glycosylase [Heyndrickxia oleronia]MCI1743061.1 uracil-DNA glycosylase [Heyndrickxia oleronia]MCI1759555.1 uracil-DNA glycosylase [Heyndrickxia oleronia]